MTSFNRSLVGSLVYAAIGMGAFAGLAAQPEQKPAEKGGAPEMPAEMQEMLEMGQLGPEHELLKPFVGVWNGTVEMFGPQAGPASKGQMTNTLILGGRFLEQRWKGDFMGQPFDGIGHWGFDRLKGKWIGTWMDSMTTGMMTSEGDHDATKKSWSQVATMTGPGGKPTTAREVVRWIDSDTNVFEMFESKDGKEELTMKITYTRAGKAR